MGERFLSLRRVIDLTSLSRTTIYRLQASGQFPRSVQVSSGRVAWIENEVQAYIDARILERAA